MRGRRKGLATLLAAVHHYLTAHSLC